MAVDLGRVLQYRRSPPDPKGAIEWYRKVPETSVLYRRAKDFITSAERGN
ncbi:hypothetical protein PGB28_16390 [Primorskyibacter aestuariivivens]|nr:hypothetical protein [Primorskyibacter aestuariivivens]MDA7430046.1 hypothetical protein [Primorskyibacter aestuariivivens]